MLALPPDSSIFRQEMVVDSDSESKVALISCACNWSAAPMSVALTGGLHTTNAESIKQTRIIDFFDVPSTIIAHPSLPRLFCYVKSIPFAHLV